MLAVNSQITLGRNLQAVLSTIAGGETDGNFCGYNICDAGALVLGKVLTANTTLKCLILWNNNIGNAGAKVIATALMINITLDSISLWSNDIGDDGAQAFAKMLRKNTTLTRLNIGNNKMGHVGLQALVTALATNNTLVCLQLWGNNLAGSGASAMLDALAKNTTLTINDFALYITFEPSRNDIRQFIERNEARLSVMSPLIARDKANDANDANSCLQSLPKVFDAISEFKKKYPKAPYKTICFPLTCTLSQLFMLPDMIIKSIKKVEFLPPQKKKIIEIPIKECIDIKEKEIIEIPIQEFIDIKANEIIEIPIRVFIDIRAMKAKNLNALIPFDTLATLTKSDIDAHVNNKSVTSNILAHNAMVTFSASNPGLQSLEHSKTKRRKY